MTPGLLFQFGFRGGPQRPNWPSASPEAPSADPGPGGRHGGATAAPPEAGGAIDGSRERRALGT